MYFGKCGQINNNNNYNGCDWSITCYEFILYSAPIKSIAKYMYCLLSRAALWNVIGH